MWEFDEIRDISLKHLEKLDLDNIDRICIAEQYDLGVEWAVEAYWTICTRPHALTFDEAQRLSLETVVRIGAIRENFRGPSRINFSARRDLKQSMKAMLVGDMEQISGNDFDGPLWSGQKYASTF